MSHQSSVGIHAVAIAPAEPVGVLLRSYSPPMAAFPVQRAGRLPRCPFRGLLSVHSRYGLHTRQIA